MRFAWLFLCFLFCMTAVSAASIAAGESMDLDSRSVTLVRTGSDYAGNYAIFSIGAAAGGQMVKIVEGETRRTQGVSIYLESVVDSSGHLDDAAVFYINGIEKSYIGERLGDSWYVLGPNERVTFDGKAIQYISAEEHVATVVVENKHVSLPLNEIVSAQGLSLMAQKVEGEQLTLRVHTLPNSLLTEEGSSKVLSLGSLSVIQGKMVDFFSMDGKKFLFDPMSKLKELFKRN